MPDGSDPSDILDVIPSFREGGGSAAPAGSEGGGGAPAADGGAGAPDKTQSGEAQPPKNALEAAERVMAQRAGASPASDKPQDGKPQDQKAIAGAKDQPADAALPFKDHPRWKEVTSENRMLRVAREKNETAIKELEPKAKGYDDLRGYLSENNLRHDDFAAMLAIGAAIRNDPMEAVRLLQPIWERLQQMVGEVLPDDLKQAVAAGQMTEEAARIASRARAEAAVATGRLKDVERRTAESRDQQEREAEDRRVDGVARQISDYVDTWAERDPDAEQKLPFVNQEIELALRRIESAGRTIRSADEVKKLVDWAVKQVEDRVRSFGPRRAATAGALPAGDGGASNTAPVPKTSLEAAELALQRTRSGAMA